MPAKKDEVAGVKFVAAAAARAEKKTKADAAESGKKLREVEEAESEEKRKEAVKQAAEINDERRAKTINAREEATVKQEAETKKPKPKKKKPSAAAEVEVNKPEVEKFMGDVVGGVEVLGECDPQAKPAEEEAASAMLAAEKQAADEENAGEGNQVEGEQEVDFTQGGHVAQEGEEGEEGESGEEGEEDESGEDGEEDGVEGEADLQMDEMMVGDGQVWWKGGRKVTGVSQGWWGFESAGGVTGNAAVEDRLRWKNDGTLHPITSAEVVDLAQVPSPLVRTPTTYPPHS